jgi:hypothetical protein
MKVKIKIKENNFIYISLFWWNLWLIKGRTLNQLYLVSLGLWIPLKEYKIYSQSKSKPNKSIDVALSIWVRF